MVEPAMSASPSASEKSRDTSPLSQPVQPHAATYPHAKQRKRPSRSPLSPVPSEDTSIPEQPWPPTGWIHKKTKSHSRNHSQTQNHRRPWGVHSTRPMTIFHPRPYEVIYAERAYLSMTLQVHSNNISDLIKRYSLLEEESIHGVSRKHKRQARKELGLLRGQLIHAADQGQAIFARLGALYIEAKSRETWDAVRPWGSLPSYRRPSQQRSEMDSRSHSITSLNAARPEFVPRKGSSSMPSQEQDESLQSNGTSHDGYSYERGEATGNGTGGSELDLATDATAECANVPRCLQRSMTADDYDDDYDEKVLNAKKRLSLPASLDLTKPAWIAVSDAG